MIFTSEKPPECPSTFTLGINREGNGMSHLARNSDPITSHLAASFVHEFSGRHVDLIAMVLRMNGPMTADDISNHCDLDKYQICRRLPEAEKAGLVRPTDKLGTTASGRAARVWEAV